VAAGLEAQGDDAAALRLIQRALELDPSNSALHYRLSDLLNRQRHTAEAAAEWRTGLKLDGDFQVLSRFDSTLRRSDLSAAKRAVARMLVERRLAQAKHQYVFPRVLVELYLQAGDKENCLQWLAKAFEEHSSFLVEIAHDPKYEPLHSDPRFQEMVRRIHAPGSN
jgi:tetratricopeptide (TPR) repeat protein